MCSKCSVHYAAENVVCNVTSHVPMRGAFLEHTLYVLKGCKRLQNLSKVLRHLKVTMPHRSFLQNRNFRSGDKLLGNTAQILSKKKKALVFKVKMAAKHITCLKQTQNCCYLINNKNWPITSKDTQPPQSNLPPFYIFVKYKIAILKHCC